MSSARSRDLDPPMEAHAQIPVTQPKAKRSLGKAVVSALVLVGLLVGSFIIGRVAFFALVVFVAGMALYELLHMLRASGHRIVTPIPLAAGIGMLFIAFFEWFEGFGIVGGAKMIQDFQDTLGARKFKTVNGTAQVKDGGLVFCRVAETGELLWTHSEFEGQRAVNAPRQLSGRGLSYWTDGKGDERILYVTPGYRLVALNAKTGAVIPSFGKDGIVDLKVGVVKGRGLQIDLEGGEIGIHSTPAIVRDVAIIGSAMREGATVGTHDNTKGLVRAFDVRTGAVRSGIRSSWAAHAARSDGAPLRAAASILCAASLTNVRAAASCSSARGLRSRRWLSARFTAVTVFPSPGRAELRAITFIGRTSRIRSRR